VGDNSSFSKESTKGKFLLPALVLARFAFTPPNLASGLLLVDIAATFGQPVGVMGQMRTTSSTLAMIAALAMAVLSIRFRHKSLLLTGLGFIALSALGCYIAPTFSTIVMVYSLVGIGASMIDPMTMTMVGTHIPLEERPRAVGWLISGNSLSYLIGAPIIAYLAGIGSWRTAFLLWVLPVALLSIGSTIFSLRARMSINSAVGSVGAAIGAFIGGLALLWYGYELVGISLGAMAVVSVIITCFLVVDPHS
jgi:predicted MFS family arabinose efflux permease